MSLWLSPRIVEVSGVDDTIIGDGDLIVREDGRTGRDGCRGSGGRRVRVRVGVGVSDGGGDGGLEVTGRV